MPFAVGNPSKMKHGKAMRGKKRRPEYVAWSAMIQRCRNPNCEKYKWYGGRGITVCTRWLDFENFFADMGERPDGLTLDRIDSNGNYEPGNCRWASWAVQAVNKRIFKQGISTGKSGIPNVYWIAKKELWSVVIVRGGKSVLAKKTKDFFEACCLVKSFLEKEKAREAM